MYSKVVDEQQNCESNGFDALGTTIMTSTDDQKNMCEIDVRAQHQNLLQEMNDSSMFYNDQFPQIPDFPCMSSSSSSSSNPAPVKPISSMTTSSASSVSSATSSAASPVMSTSATMATASATMATASATAVGGSPSLQSVDGSGMIDCMDVMENFGYMDLFDGNEMWDPSAIFESDPPELQPESEVLQEFEMKEGGGGGRLDELGVMFFEWLKSNKEFISAEDMRSIKLKRSTVECASKRLGSSKEGKKQLLKLILEWVQKHQLQRKKSGDVTSVMNKGNNCYPLQHFQGLPPPRPSAATPPPRPSAATPPPFSSCTPREIGSGFSPSWFPPYPSCMTDQVRNGIVMVASQPPGPPASTYPYVGSDYNSGWNCQLPVYNNNAYNNSNSVDYQVLESGPSWNPSQISAAESPYNNQFPDHVGNNFAPQVMPIGSCYPVQYPCNPVVYNTGDGDEPRLGSSATKEARKKRMARQRRTYFHHHHHSRQNQDTHHNHVSNTDHYSHAMLVEDNIACKSHGGNWLFWPTPSSPTTVPQATMEAALQPASGPLQSGDRHFKQISLDKRQELKTEKNLKFLLQKVLKQSDVGSLGRIVLPKKEAESHLPDLDSRDGISIPMEDIGTSRVWNMRYRFWPNNKSRMYLLENTGDFVKANGLQEGDFIVIYSDVKCGKYLIRGVKVRQPATGKSEGKKPVKRSYRAISQSARSSPSPPAKIAAI